MQSSNTWVVNFANSIVGVGVLAIPFCFHKCGIIMAILLILTSNLFTKTTCEFLLKAAQYTRMTGYENIANHILGHAGKLTTELCTIGMLIGTLVAFQVVIGDLSPPLISHALNLEESWSLRAVLMCLSCLVIIPLSLMRNISSLASMNAMSMVFYITFICAVALMSLENLISFKWLSQVRFWRPEGFFHCLPIISLAFSCQTQVFVMYEALPDPTVKAMNEIIRKAINLVTTMYISVGIFGYITFYAAGIRGDILANFPNGFLAELMKTGFWISVVISFPLLIFPLRVALHSLLFSREQKENEIISSAADYIPQERFVYITLALVIGTLLVGITVPHIETVLSFTGACIGTFLCFVFPAALYLRASPEGDKRRTFAKVIFVVSLIGMVISTGTVLSTIGSHEESSPHVNLEKEAFSDLHKDIKVDSIPDKLSDHVVKPQVNVGDPGVNQITDKPPGIVTAKEGRTNLKILSEDNPDKGEVKSDDKVRETRSEKPTLSTVVNALEKTSEKTGNDDSGRPRDGNRDNENKPGLDSNDEKSNRIVGGNESDAAKKRVRKNESSSVSDAAVENKIKSRGTKNVPEAGDNEKSGSETPPMTSAPPSPPITSVPEQVNNDLNQDRPGKTKIGGADNEIAVKEKEETNHFKSNIGYLSRNNSVTSDLLPSQNEPKTGQNLAKILMLTTKRLEPLTTEKTTSQVKNNLIRQILEKNTSKRNS